MDAAIPTLKQNNKALHAPSQLHFKRMTMADIPTVAPLLREWQPGARTCDYSVGGMFMWTDYFRYEYCIYRNTLFVSGLNEMNLNEQAFSLPCGELPLGESVELLRQYCAARNIKCLLSAVPEPLLPQLRAVADIADVEPLSDWSDYLYDINAMATLSGKKMSKKRNHVNRFTADNPGYTIEPYSEANRAETLAFFKRQRLSEEKGVTADFERLQVLEVLRHPADYPFEGAVLRTPAHGIVAFTLGEPIGDTLYVHVEKMDHQVAGAGESISKLFCEMMMQRYPGLRYVNREEDTGDEGLRRAKLSYHPEEIVAKCNVLIQ